MSMSSNRVLARKAVTVGVAIGLVMGYIVTSLDGAPSEKFIWLVIVGIIAALFTSRKFQTATSWIGRKLWNGLTYLVEYTIGQTFGRFGLGVMSAMQAARKFEFSGSAPSRDDQRITESRNASGYVGLDELIPH